MQIIYYSVLVLSCIVYHIITSRGLTIASCYRIIISQQLITTLYCKIINAIMGESVVIQ